MSDRLEELEELVSELYDDGLSDAALARLEEILVDNPELQDRYCGLVDTHVALRVAGASSVETEAPEAQQKQPLAFVPGTDKLTPHAPPSSYKPTQANLKYLQLAAVAAAIFLAAFGWYQWTVPHSPLASNGELPAWSSGLSSLPTITHVSWEGPSFTADSDYWQPVAAVSGGAISLQQDQGEAADGYLFCLQPGMSVELVASCDATGQNSLSITEITYDAKPSTKKLTFHNKGDGKGPKPLHANPSAKQRRYGVLGRWSEVNTTARPRYFLLTGVHKLVDLYPDDQWRVSEMGVLLETGAVIHVGWDDSGPAPAERGEPYEQDRDYDDLAATLFFAPMETLVESQPGEIEVLSPHQVEGLALPAEGVDGLDFELAPGEFAVVKALADATDPNALAVVDTATGKVLWSSASAKSGSSYVGTTALRNSTDETAKLRLVGLNKPKTDPEKWVASQCQISYSQPTFFIVGFEDSLDDGDFNDLRASLLLEPGSPEGEVSLEQ